MQVKLRNWWSTNQIKIYALILTIYSLPDSFYYDVDTAIDSSWKQALTYSVIHKVTFGSGFVFTYGPLGFISTRYIYHLSSVPLLLADVFLCVCLYYLISTFLKQHKGWFFILLAAIFCFKGAESATTLFFFFIVFAILALKNNFTKPFELVCCGICGVIVFFVKLNYGLIVLPLMLCILLLLLFRNRKAFLILSGVCCLTFLIIYSMVHIDIVNYVRYSIPMVLHYPEAMAKPITMDDPSFLGAKSYILIYLGILCWYGWQLRKTRNLSLSGIMPVLLLGLMFFLAYKNGFTRADGILRQPFLHISTFFLFMPIFIAFTLFLLGFAATRLAKVICICALLLSAANVTFPLADEGPIFLYNATVGFTVNYFTTLFSTQSFKKIAYLSMPPHQLKVLGRSTIDIIPTDISILFQNNLNYKPRPVVQSYSAYSPELDELNAHHFSTADRPEFVILSNAAIDVRCPIWDESITKAVLHLNYGASGYTPIDSDILKYPLNTSNYMLYRAKPGVYKYPKFDTLYKTTIAMEDTVHINFPDSIAVYMSAVVDERPLARIRDLLFQPPVLNATMFIDKGKYMPHKAVCSLLREPLLINKAITNNNDLNYFIYGNLKGLQNIHSFCFHSDEQGFNDSIKVVYYKFSNY